MAEHQEDPGKALKEKSMQAFAERTKGKPTPTQDELDRTNLGEHLTEHEPDGSEVEESLEVRTKKQSEARPSSGGYATRQPQPQQRPRSGE
jgi:hypothetical protein